jgi:FAD synthase
MIFHYSSTITTESGYKIYLNKCNNNNKAVRLLPKDGIANKLKADSFFYILIESYHCQSIVIGVASHAHQANETNFPQNELLTN